MRSWPSELGPRHPALRQTEKQVEDLDAPSTRKSSASRKSAKNDLTRARDYEASLSKALEAQKRQSVAAQPGLGAPARTRARRRSQPRRLSILPQALARDRGAGDPEHLGGTHHRRGHGAAAAHLPAGDEPDRDDRFHLRRRWRPPPGLSRPIICRPARRAQSGSAPRAVAGYLPPGRRSREPPWPSSRQLAAQPAHRSDRKAADRAPAGIRRHPHARRYPRHRRQRRRHPAGLADAARRLSADDVRSTPARDARDRWPGVAGGKTMPVMARDRRRRHDGPQRRRAEFRARRRARRRQGADDRCRPSRRTRCRTRSAVPARASPAGSAGSRSAARPRARSRPQTEFRSCRPQAPDAKAGDAIRKAIAQARSAGGYDLVILDGPAMPWSAADRKLLDTRRRRSSRCCRSASTSTTAMEEIIAALGGAERKLVGVVLDELNPTAVKPSARQTICLSVA